MSEEKDAPVKKKGKLPVIIALVAVLGGGGFFVMKGKSKPKEAPKAPELGEIIDIKDDFLTNVQGTSANYIRAGVSLWLKKDVKGEEVSKQLGAIQSVITMRLRNTPMADFKSLEGIRKLQKEIASEVNEVLEAAPGEGHPELKPEGGEKPSGKAEVKVSYTVPDNWDSATGPVLRVLFRQLVTQ